MSEQHTHEWVKAEQSGILAWRCTECAETSATCGTCEKASGSTLLLCPSCEKGAAKVLDDIAHALGQWEPNPRSPMHSPGDMRLVLSTGTSAGITTPSDIEDNLWAWVGRWAEHSGADNAYALEYLRSRHLWASHNQDVSDWAAYLVAMRSLRAQARRIAGLLPQRLPEPCIHCGGRVVQDWSDGEWMPFEDGLSDIVRCTGCDMTWGSRAHWLLMNRDHLVELPALHPDALVTIEQARMIWPDVPSATWRWWAMRWRDEGDEMIERVHYWWGLRCAFKAGPHAWPAWAPEDWQGPGESPSLAGWLPQMGDRDGVPTYRVGDLHALAVRRVDGTRQGRPASERITA